MNEENNNPVTPVGPPMAESQGAHVVTSSRPDTEKVIQPSAAFAQEIREKQQAAASPAPTSNIYRPPASTIYPEATKTIQSTDRTASQQFAVAANEIRAKESDKPVSLRVKSLLIVAILSLFGASYTLYQYFTLSEKESFSIIIPIVCLFQLCLTVYMFVGKDHNTMALILKIFLVLQLVALFMSFANPTQFIINGIYAILLFYVYLRVKSLSYY